MASDGQEGQQGPPAERKKDDTMRKASRSPEGQPSGSQTPGKARVASRRSPKKPLREMEQVGGNRRPAAASLASFSFLTYNTAKLPNLGGLACFLMLFHPQLHL